MILILKHDLDIIIMYYYAKNEVSMSIHWKVIARTDRQTDRHTHTDVYTQTDTQNITSTVYAGGNKYLWFIINVDPILFRCCSDTMERPMLFDDHFTTWRCVEQNRLYQLVVLCVVDLPVRLVVLLQWRFFWKFQKCAKLDSITQILIESETAIISSNITPTQLLYSFLYCYSFVFFMLFSSLFPLVILAYYSLFTNFYQMLPI